MKIFKYNKNNYLRIVDYQDNYLQGIFGSTIATRPGKTKFDIKDKILKNCKNVKMARDMVVIYNRSKNGLFVRVVYFKNKHEFLYLQKLSMISAIHGP